MLIQMLNQILKQLRKTDSKTGDQLWRQSKSVVRGKFADIPGNDEL